MKAMKISFNLREKEVDFYLAWNLVFLMKKISVSTNRLFFEFLKVTLEQEKKKTKRINVFLFL